MTSLWHHHTGLRILASNKGATAIEEATALTWKMQDIDVYSNSWGPSDTGAAVSGPGATLMEALKQGVTNVSITILPQQSLIHRFARVVKEKGPSTPLLLAMAEKMSTPVQLMAISAISTL